MKEDMSEKYLSTLCSNSLALSGFAFASLAFMIGFFQHNLESVSSIIIALMFSTVLFFVSSEIAREGKLLAEYLLSEIAYYIASLTLFVAFALFVSNLPFLSTIAEVAIAIPIALLCLRIAYSVYLLLRLH
jgi:hypothetical protein